MTQTEAVEAPSARSTSNAQTRVGVGHVVSDIRGPKCGDVFSSIEILRIHTCNSMMDRLKDKTWKEGTCQSGPGQDWERKGMETSDRMHRWAGLTLGALAKRKRQLLGTSLDSDLMDWLTGDEQEDSSPPETEPEYDENEDDLAPSCGPECSEDCKECYMLAGESDSE